MDETPGLVQVVQTTETGRKPPRPARPVLEVMLCAVASLFTIEFPSIGTAVMVYGAWLLYREEEHRGLWAIAACLVPGVVLSFVSWDFGSLVLPCATAALAIAMLLPGRVNVTTVCAVIVGLTGLMVAADASLVMLQGESFAGYVQALLDELRQLVTASLTTSTSTVALQASVDSTIELLGKVWPLMYVSRAVFAVVAGLIGLVLARRDTYQKVYRAFTCFDVPLWCVAVLVGCLAAFAVQLLYPACPDMVGTIALNLVLCMRVLFFIQGFAMALCLMDRHGWGPVPRVLLISLMLLAELGLYVVTVLGVLDVWANLRKLPRKDGTAERRHGEGE